MAIVLKDRVKETTATTGTGSFTLAGAVGGFQAFSAVGNTNFTYYAAVDNSTGDWEIGYGQYLTAGPTLTRTTILSSSAAGAKISFAAGTKDVFVTYPAGKSIYEEASGNVLIDGGPITVIGSGVTGYTTFSAALGELYGNINNFAQLYAQNLNNGSEASTDIVAYNDLGDGNTNFIDMGISSSNYTSATYPIFTPKSGYLYNDGGELIIGSATDDVVLFAGGVDTTDEAARIDKTTKALTTAAGVNVGGALDVTGAAVFGSTVLLDANPTLALQAATKDYVDGQVAQGFTVHTPVKAVANTYTGAGATYNNGAGTITSNTNGAFGVIDGVTINLGDRVLLRALTNSYENGVYTLTTVGNAGAPWVLTRATDFDVVGPGEIANNAYFFVSQGTTYTGYAYVLSQLTSPIVLGTTPLPFTEFASQTAYTVVAPLDLTGTTLSLTGTIAATLGGTGTSTVTTGDLLYGSATDTWSKLPAGAGYRSLVMNGAGTLPEWNAVALNQSGAVSGALPATNGGTGQNAYAVGDTLYSGTTNTLDKLAGNTTTIKKFLGQTGTGAASAAPVWEQPAATDITGLAASATTDTTNASNISSGTLPVARLTGSYTGITGVGTLAAGTWNGTAIAAIYGGTGQTTYAIGDLLYADTTTSLAKLADVATGNALISGGVGAAPSWGKIGLATHVSGTLPIANGGTNSTATPTNGGVAYGTSTAYAFSSAGTSGQLLTSAGAGAPTWTSQSSITAGTATNVAGGAANQVLYQSGAGATTFTVAPTTAGTSLTWNGTAFVWQTAGAATLQNDTSTNATYYPTFATATSGAFTDARVSSTKLTFNPNTGLLSATGFSGPLTGDVTGNATTSSSISGFNNPTTAPTASTIAYRDSAGDIAAREIVLSSGLSASVPTVLVSMLPTTNQMVRTTPGAVASAIQSAASGTWGINVTGNSATTTTASNSSSLGGYAANTFIGQFGNSYYQTNTWIQFNGQYGLYWPATNAAELTANTTSSYGGISVLGTRNTWQGIHFQGGGSQPHLMFDGNSNGGIYYEVGGRWESYYNYSDNCTGFGTSTTNSAYNLYAPKGLYSGGRVDSPIFYDSNDTGYYLDPNSTSQSAQRIRGGALHGPNVTWGAYLLVGGDGRNGYVDNSTVASVCTSSGNLHIDAASGYETYINFHDGGTVNFGNGANGIVSSNNTDGSHRATIFYDYNNTGYYVDPASTSNLNALNINGSAAVSATTSFSGNGYIRFSNGMIFQWGSFSAGVGFTAISFPIAFPSVCYGVTTSYQNRGASGDYRSVSAVSRTGATVGTDNCIAFWYAVGV